LDCDREGEAIAFDVKDLCTQVNKQIQVLRAIFSAITKVDIFRAFHNTRKPNKNMALAVEAR